MGEESSAVSLSELVFPLALAAYSYPIATLSRTMNPYTNNILEYVSFIQRSLASVQMFWA